MIRLLTTKTEAYNYKNRYDKKYIKIGDEKL